MGFGIGHLLVLLAIALVIFGTKKLRGLASNGSRPARPQVKGGASRSRRAA